MNRRASMRTVVATAFIGVFAPVFATACASDPWTSVVVSMDRNLVCTAQLQPGRNPGGPRPCFRYSEVKSSVLETLDVGDCVHVNVHHPTLVIESEVTCPQPATPLPTTTPLRVPADCGSLIALLRLSPATTAERAVVNIRREERDLDPSSAQYLQDILDVIERLPPSEPLSDALEDVPCPP